MAIPVGVPRVTVSSGQALTGPGGTVRKGHFVFTGPELVTISGEEYTLGGSEPAYLIDGVLSVDLVPQDVPTMNPTDWSYTVHATFADGETWERHMRLSMSALGRVKLTGLYQESGVSMAQPCGIELVDGRVPAAIRRVTSDFTVRPLDRTLICDTAGAGFTATLPDADVNAVTFVLKNVGSNSLTVATTGSQLIYTTSGTGATTATVTTGQTLRVQAMYNGTAWGWYAV